jgi:hypothetical protein
VIAHDIAIRTTCGPTIRTALAPTLDKERKANESEEPEPGHRYGSLPSPAIVHGCLALDASPAWKTLPRALPTPTVP